MRDLKALKADLETIINNQDSHFATTERLWKWVRETLYKTYCIPCLIYKENENCNCYSCVFGTIKMDLEELDKNI